MTEKDIKDIVESSPEHQEELANKNKDWSIPASIILAGIIIAGSVIYSTGVISQEQRKGASAAPPIGNAVVLGDPNAPVTMIEYGDFQCPFCLRFFLETEPQIVEKYVKTGKVKLVYKDYAFLGPESVAAAEAAKCAGDQGKFWSYHDALFREEHKDGFENNGNLKRDLFLRLARELGMDEKQFASCVDERKYKSAVEAENAEAKSYNVSGTPSFFVGERFIVGAQPFAQFEEAILAELNKK
jgi:protein-disulfide isomerase